MQMPLAMRQSHSNLSAMVEVFARVVPCLERATPTGSKQMTEEPIVLEVFTDYV
jgi:hypothetical protein